MQSRLYVVVCVVCNDPGYVGMQYNTDKAGYNFLYKSIILILTFNREKVLYCTIMWC